MTRLPENITELLVATVAEDFSREAFEGEPTLFLFLRHCLCFSLLCDRNLEYVCKENGRCVVDVTRRNQCQACRFRKCLQVNMKRDGKLCIGLRFLRSVYHDRCYRFPHFQHEIIMCIKYFITYYH